MQWVRTVTELELVARRLASAARIAVDTEGDSLHHYPARLALLQVADDAGDTWLVDPLALADLSPLGAVFGDPRVVTVLHAGDNDLALLKRRHAFAFVSIFDTSVAARLLGDRALGLDVLLARYLGVELPPSRQKDDWSARPLSAPQERYAAADVQHLLALQERLVAELARAGRLAWVEEECAALAAQPAPEPEVDPDAYAGLKGARDLSPRGLAVLRELYETRERLALEADRPPFKVLASETLVRLAVELPADAAGLGRIPGFTPRAIARWGEAVLAAIGRGLAVPDSELPSLARPSRPSVSAAVRRRVELLRGWRSAAAPRLNLDPGVLLPNRLIGAIASAAPRDLEALAAVEGLRRWRVETVGAEILAAIAPASSGSAPGRGTIKA